MPIENLNETGDIEVKTDEEWLCVNVNRIVTRNMDRIVVDLRQYVATETYEGFTKKGVSLDPSHIDEVIRLLIDAKQQAEVEQAKQAPKAPAPKRVGKKTAASKATARKQADAEALAEAEAEAELMAEAALNRD